MRMQIRARCMCICARMCVAVQSKSDRIEICWNAKSARKVRNDTF